MKSKLIFILFSTLFGTFSIFAQWSNVGNTYGYTEMVREANNKLYANGAYNFSGTGLALGVFEWDGNIWAPIACTDTLGIGYYKAIVFHNNGLYVGGQFPMIGKWDGNNWTYLGSGIPSGNSYIKDLEIFNGDLYAAGRFNNIGGLVTKGISKWNGTNWVALSSGLQGGTITAYARSLTIYDNELYVGGDFNFAGGAPANNIAKWNGTSWHALGSGMNDYINDMVVDTINNFLYFVGPFTIAGGKNAHYVAKWDGFILDSVGRPPGYEKLCLEMYHGQLYVGGVAGIESIYDTILTRWDGEQWHQLIGPNCTLFDMAVFNNELYICGCFTQVEDDTSAKWVARYSAPWDTNCGFLQPIIESMNSLISPNGVSDTFHITDSVKVQFYNNIQSASLWQWDFGDGNTGTDQTPEHYYDTSGIFNVSVIVTYPWGPYGTCVDTAYKTIIVEDGSDIEEYLKEKINVDVYPNPAGENTCFSIPGKAGCRISITDISGKTVHNAGITGDKYLFDVKDLRQGIYFYKIEFAAGQGKAEGRFEVVR